ncbi:hypothetical protein CVT24_011354, partial [Panaeolus cyanescens]
MVELSTSTLVASHHTCDVSDITYQNQQDTSRSDYGTINGERRRSESPRRQIGIISAVFIIFNRMIGTGIFATPSTILGFSGSIGLSLLMWIIGALIASAGMQVYIVWGTALPHNGGEKNYLEHLIPRPRQLITSIYAANAVLLGYAAGNSLVFAEYLLASVDPSAPHSSTTSVFSPVRVVAFLCLTAAALLHGLHIPSGLKLQNGLGALKIIVLIIMVGTGVAALMGVLQPGVTPPRNFSSWEKIWEGTQTGGNVVCACLYNVIWSYIGFSNANYALAEIQNPGRTLRIAGPLAIITVTVFYLLCNIAYFSAASKEEITGSGRLVAALLFRNVWGVSAERLLNSFVALSALGNVLSVSFSQGRVNQALGHENVLPFSKFWSSSWPSNAPLAGLSLHWAVCNVIIFGLPAGDAYNFVINVISYPLAVINAIISFGLIYIAAKARWSYTALQSRWERRHLSSPSNPTHDSERQPLIADSHSAIDTPQDVFFDLSPLSLLSAVVFGIASIFLFVMPLAKPPPGIKYYDHLPYWIHAAGGWGVFIIGGIWWW